MMSDWVWGYEGFEPDQEGLREALCTLGNGYFATRGAAAESSADGVHYPGTYLGGGYNRLTSEVKGRVLENEDLVNVPNWLPLTFRPEGEDAWFRVEAVEILGYRQELDLQRGILHRDLTVRDRHGRDTRVQEARLVHMGAPHLAAQRLTLTALNWSGRVEVSSGLDGGVVNAGVPRYRGLANRHLEPLWTETVGEEAIMLGVRTSQSRLEIAQAARTRAFDSRQRRIQIEPTALRSATAISQLFSLDMPARTSVTVEKVVSLCTSRDRAISECGLEARKALARAADFEALAASHATVWRHLWHRFDLGLGMSDESDRDTIRILRLHLFHLLQTASPNIMDLDVGVPARGLHGEAYRGHIFWDELFIFPLLNLRLPEITRALLHYRYRRLDEARVAARSAGFAGALYPWQSGSDGREETQRMHLNPRSGRWVPDETQLQYHVNAAIAYNVWQYYEVTGDHEFLAFYGAEMMLEIARFWASLACHNQDIDRYEIHGVMGPDEFQTGYPDAQEPGLRNNAYTNLMAVWVLWRALELPRHLPTQRWLELRESLGLQQSDLERWEAISRKMRLSFHDNGILSQFEGYEALAELDWGGYRRKYGDIQRLDRILEAEDDTPNRYKASKQADALMLFYLFSAPQLRALFERLGYPFHEADIPRTIDYYLHRTTNGSTLSGVVHAWVLARSDRPGSWDLFTEALRSDVGDVQGGTTAEGIHLGAMAGTVDLVQRAYTGLEVGEACLRLDPRLPEDLRCLRLRVRYRECTLNLEITQERLRVRVPEGEATPIELCVGKQRLRIETSGEWTFDLA